jgi:hypothetical protein
MRLAVRASGRNARHAVASRRPLHPMVGPGGRHGEQPSDQRLPALIDGWKADGRSVYQTSVGLKNSEPCRKSSYMSGSRGPAAGPAFNLMPPLQMYHPLTTCIAPALQGPLMALPRPTLRPP